jgi:nitrate reductase delta subunit
VLLQEYRASIELLRFALIEADTPYAGVVEAVCSVLPGVSPADRAAVHRMAEAGPPREEVGLDAYDPRLLPLAGPATTGSPP